MAQLLDLNSFGLFHKEGPTIDQAKLLQGVGKNWHD
jgi:hypothetical protein